MFLSESAAYPAVASIAQSAYDRLVEDEEIDYRVLDELIGEGATVGHLCVVHGAVVGFEALIGNGATVLDGAIVGSHALVAAGATVPPGMEIPDGMLAAGVPARVLGELTPGAKQWVDTNPEIYRALARRHASGVTPVTG